MNVLIRRVVGATVVAGVAFALIGLAAGQSATTGTTQTSSGGRVIAKGPGYSIVATGAGNQAGETAVTDAPLETLHEPIVCRGQRELSIDNRNIRFAGNAVTA